MLILRFFSKTPLARGMSGGPKPRKLILSRRPEQVIEAELSWISALVLFFSTVYMAVRPDPLWVAFGISAISLYILPIVTLRDPFRAIPWEMVLLLVAPMLLHVSENSRILMEHVGWWNDFVSLAFAFSLSTLGFLLTVEVQMFTDVKMNRPFAVFFVVMFTLAVSGFWEVGTYIGDVVNDTDRLGSNSRVMMNLVWTLIGGMLMGFVYDLYMKTMSQKRRLALGFIHLWEVRT